MIPTIQLVYGSMPVIRNFKSNHCVLQYNPEFYLFKDTYDILGKDPCYTEKDKIFNFLCKTFNCFSKQSSDFNPTNSREPVIYYHFYNTWKRCHLITFNMDSSIVINTLITDEFYDSFQVLLNDIKNQNHNLI